MYTNNRIYLLVFFLIVILRFTAYSQSPAPQFVKEPKFQSPNAGALGKFGDTPISYHTGVPEISIPIYTVQEGSLSVPITLSYHSSGVKVDEVASWVGLGWNLSAGGSITRTINGGPDEGRAPGTYNDSYGSGCGITGWYKNYGFPSCLNLDATGCGSPNPNNGQGVYGGSTCWSKYMAASRGYTDTEPDLYSFSVPGHSGKFFFDNNRKAHMISENDYLVAPEQEPNLFKTWKIISPDGTKYYFGGVNATENTYSGTNAYTPGDENKSSTTWHLTKIESPNGEHWIQFEYEPEKSSYGTKLSHTFVLGVFGSSGTYTTAVTGYSLASTNGVRISKITTKSLHTTVEFNESLNTREDLTAYTDGDFPTTEAKPLDNIRIAYGDRCKTFTLGLSYFLSKRTATAVTPDTPFDAKRLKLISLRESTCDNSIINPPYLFFYNESEPIPRRYSFAQDHWGYHNGQGNLMLLPTDAINIVTGNSLGTAIRSANEGQMKLGILEKITYPTGGHTSFTYEAHRENPTAPAIIGGLRVKTISDSDGAGQTVTKTINYINGNLYAPISNGSYMQDPLQNLFASGLDWGLIYSSAPNPPLQSTHGYHIGYSVVEVDFGGIGKSIYRYNNNSPITSFAYPRVPTIAVIGTGVPSSEEHYNSNGSLLQSVSYQYENTGGNFSVTGRKITTLACFNKDPDHVQSLRIECTGESIMFTDYTLSTYRNNLVSKTEYKDGTTKITNYSYDPSNKHNNPKSEELLNSDGSLRRTEFTYPTDAGSGAPAVLADPANSGFKNMLNAVIEQKVFTNSSQTNRQLNQYIESGSRVLLTSSKSYPTGNSEFMENQYDYDVNSNIINIRRSNGSNSCFIWGYGNTLPVAEINNALANQVFFTGFEEDATNLAAWSHTGTKAHTGSYTVNIPSPGTYMLSYWQKLSAPASWQYVELNNVAANQTIGGTGVAIDDIRLFPKGALMTTYNYQVGVGITSSSDPNNITSYYEYDAFGRLLAMKDDKGNILKTYKYNYKQ